MLYDLAKLDDNAIRAAVRHMLLIVPCDRSIQNAFEQLNATPLPIQHKSTTTKGNSLERKKLTSTVASAVVSAASRSPKLAARFAGGGSTSSSSSKSHSPKSSISTKIDETITTTNGNGEQASIIDNSPHERLKKLFDCTEPFRLLYNLEVSAIVFVKSNHIGFL